MTDYLTRSRYEYEYTMCTKDAEADVYRCKGTIHMTMHNPNGHKAPGHNHGLGNNPGKAVSDHKYNKILVIRKR